MSLPFYDPNCSLCELHRGARTVCVPFRGELQSPIGFVGESPGGDEDVQGRPFVGRSGALLSDCLREVGIDESKAWFDNVVKCFPRGKATVPAKSVKACRPYIKEVILASSSNVVVLLGGTAMKSVLKKAGILRQQGKIFESDEFPGKKFIPCVHPAAALRFPHYRNQIIEVLRAARTEGLYQGMRELPQFDHTLITSAKGVHDLRKRIDAEPDGNLVSFDTETKRLHPAWPDAKLLGVSVSWAPEEAAFIPFYHREFDIRNYPEMWNRAREFLTELLSLPRYRTTAQNAKYDMRWVWASEEIQVLNLWLDSMILAHQVDENRPIGLKDITWTYTPFGGYERELETHPDFQVDDYESLPLEILWKYGCWDTEIGRRITVTLEPQITPRQKELHQGLLIPVLHAMMDAELCGVDIDVPHLKYLEERYDTRLGLIREILHERPEVKEAVRRLNRDELNFNSSQQLQVLFFQVMGLESLRKTKTGQDCTDQKVLGELAALSKSDVPSIVVKYKKTDKIKGSYIVKFQKHLCPGTSLVYPEYRICGAASGRPSATDPPIQTVPRDKDIRDMVIAPGDSILAYGDYDQEEYRVAACVSMDARMIWILQTGRDPHRMTAAQILGVHESDVTEQQRDLFKNCNYEILFLGSAFQLSRMAKISVPEAERYIEETYKFYSGYKRWTEEIIKFCRRHKYVETLTGHISRLPAIDSDDNKARGHAERQAVNRPIQGTAAHVTYYAWVRMLREIHRMKLPSRVNIEAHDALMQKILDPERLDEAAEMQVRIMEGVEFPWSRKAGVRFTADLKVGKKWGTMKKWERPAT